MAKKKVIAPAQEPVVEWQLGDAVEAVTTATGIKAIVKHMVGEDCGCDERKEKLNEWGNKIQDKIATFFRRNTIKPLTPEEYEYLDTFFSRPKLTMKPSEQYRMLEINNRVFSQRLQYSTCGSCVQSMVNQLKHVYDAYTTA
jgi:hypothetical protein